MIRYLFVCIGTNVKKMYFVYKKLTPPVITSCRAFRHVSVAVFIFYLLETEDKTKRGIKGLYGHYKDLCPRLL